MDNSLALFKHYSEKTQNKKRLNQAMTHFLVLEDEVAFDLGWLTVSDFTYSASGSCSLSFVVYEGVFLSIFFDLRCSAAETKAFCAEPFLNLRYSSILSGSFFYVPVQWHRF